MALLPIIYISILITAILIVAVVLFSYLASRIRNRNNVDRILAIASSGASSQQNMQQTPKIVVQKKKHSKPSSFINDREIYARQRSESTRSERITELEHKSRQQETSASPDNLPSHKPKRFTSERRNYPERFQQRVEIINQTMPETQTYSGGEVKITASNPLYFYSAKNDQQFYSIKAS